MLYQFTFSSFAAASPAPLALWDGGSRGGGGGRNSASARWLSYCAQLAQKNTTVAAERTATPMPAA